MLDRQRFAKLCEGLSNPSAVARGVTAAKITGLLQALDLTWANVLAGQDEPCARETLERLHGVPASTMIAAVGEHVRDLSPGDKEFIRTLQRTKLRALSRFQWAVLMRIAIQTDCLMEAAE